MTIFLLSAFEKGVDPKDTSKVLAPTPGGWRLVALVFGSLGKAAARSGCSAGRRPGPEQGIWQPEPLHFLLPRPPLLLRPSAPHLRHLLRCPREMLEAQKDRLWPGQSRPTGEYGPFCSAL